MTTFKFLLTLTAACLLLSLVCLPLPVVGETLSGWSLQAAVLCALFCIPAALRDGLTYTKDALRFFGWPPR